MDGDSLTVSSFDKTSEHGGKIVQNSDGTFTYNPLANFNGTDSFSYTISDGNGGTSTATVSLTVNAVADAPTLTVQPARGSEDTTIALNINSALTDTDGSENLLLTISHVPTGVVLSAGTDNHDGSWTLTPAQLSDLTITPPANSDTDFSLSVTATSTEAANGAKASSTATLNVTVDPVNDAPTVVNAIADQFVSKDATFSFTLPANTFRDIDAGDSLSFSATLSNGNALPSWLTFNPNTRTFSGTPTNSNVGVLSIKVTATDSANASISDTFNLAVANIFGSPDNNSLQDTPGNDVIAGNGGDDFINVYNGGQDVVDGGVGYDYLQVAYNNRNTGGGLTFNAASGVAQRTNASGTVDSVKFSNFENYYVFGTVGNDTITGGTGNDHITTGIGGQDVVDGGAGSYDYLTVEYGLRDNGGSGLTFNAASGSAQRTNASGTVDSVKFSNFENYNVYGSVNDDIITGGTGNDYIDGNSGNDLIAGGAGYDGINTGAGSDRLLYNTGVAFKATDIGVDSIYDFTSGADKFVLSATTFTAISGGVTFEAVANDLAAASSAAAIVFSNETGKLYYNENGTNAGFGTGSQFATLYHNQAIAATDFILG